MLPAASSDAGMPLRLLCVGGRSADAAGMAVSSALAGRSRTARAESSRAALAFLGGEAFDLLLCSLETLGDKTEERDAAVGRLARAAGGALLMAVTSGDSVSAAVSAMRAGAHGCVRFDLAPADLLARLRSLAAQIGRGGPLAGTSAATPPHTGSLPMPAIERRVVPMWRQEQRIIEDTIALFSGNIAMAAAALEISPSTIYRKRQGWADAHPASSGY